MTKPLYVLITLILSTLPPLEAINLTDDYTTQEYDETTLIDDVENVPNYYEENPQYENSNPGVVIPLERILAGLEAIENEEDLIISDESNLHHTKYNQSQDIDEEGTEPKYAMFENFPIVNNPEATGNGTIHEQNLVKVDEHLSKTENTPQNFKIKETVKLNVKNKKENPRQESHTNQHPRTNRYPDKKFGRIGGYKEDVQKQNNNQPIITEDENLTNSYSNQSETDNIADNNSKIKNIEEERKSSQKISRVNSSPFNNEFSKRRRRPNQVPAWKRGNSAKLHKQLKYSQKGLSDKSQAM
jgi:hypothetical protein